MTEAEEKAVIEVLRSRWIGLGPKTKELEDKFAEYTESKYCVTLNSCTAALDMALRLCNVRQHDKVLVPTMTFVSTAHAVCYNDAMPIFVDCDETLQMDIIDLERKIDKFVKAIIVVHYGGRINSHIKQIAEICKEKGIYLIEDCAHAAGSWLNDKHAGTFGDIGCFSFHAVKNLAMGDGGAIITANEEMATRAKKVRWLGIDRGTWDRTANNKEYWWEYIVDEIGYKNHPCDILSAIGVEQLKKLEAMNNMRYFIYNTYRENLKTLIEQGLIEIMPDDTTSSLSSWHLMVIKVSELDRNDLSLCLKEKGVNTGVHYRPIHMYPCYGNTPHLPIAEEIFKKILSLPMYYDLTAEDVKIICNHIKEFYE
jgi:perosamine synthetase